MANIHLMVHHFIICWTLASGQLLFFNDEIIEDEIDFEGLAGNLMIMAETVEPSSSIVTTPAPTECLPYPEAPDNGFVDVDCTSDDKLCKAYFSCEEGYKLTGAHVKVCQKKQGIWRGNSEPACTPIKNCGQPNLKNANSNGSGSQPGDRRQVSCEADYTKISGDDDITCQTNGLWSEGPTCQFDGCTTVIEDSQNIVAWKCKDNTNTDCSGNVTCPDGQKSFPAETVECNELVQTLAECIEEDDNVGTFSIGLESITGKEVKFDNEYKKAVTEYVEGVLREALGDRFKGLSVEGFNMTTGIITYKYNIEDSDAARKELAKALGRLRAGETADLFGKKIKIAYSKVNDLPVYLVDSESLEQLHCKLLLNLKPDFCPADPTCKNKDEEFDCIKLVQEKEDNNAPEILLLSIVLPACFLACCIAACCCWALCCRRKAKAADESFNYDLFVGILPRYCTRTNTRTPIPPGWGSGYGSSDDDSPLSSSRGPSSSRGSSSNSNSKSVSKDSRSSKGGKGKHKGYR